MAEWLPISMIHERQIKRAAEAQETAVLSDWLRIHACAMLLAVLLAIADWSAIPVALISFASFAFLAYRVRRQLARLRPYGGHANRLTAARLIIVLSAAWLLTEVSEIWLLLLLGVNVVMDVADGSLARSTRQVTRIGGVFDGETDAVFVLVAYLYFFLAEGVAPWILLPGMLPYIYRLLNWLLRSPEVIEAKQRHAAMLAGVNYVLLLTAVVAPAQQQLHVLVVSTSIVTASFCISFLKSRRYAIAVSK